jgi:GNAT superfamily N-acetyltransferase
MAERFVPLSPDRWDDFVELFGPRGACAGCWCMWPRLPAAEWKRGAGQGNKRRMKKLVDSAREPPGLLAYVDGRPAGWIAFAPRDEYVRLDRSRVWKRVDERPVWSISCFFVARPFRGRGLTVKLLRAAAAHAKRRGARLLEGYPIDSAGGDMPDAFVWTGMVETFREVGFVEVARRSPSKPIMRLELSRAPRAARAATW